MESLFTPRAPARSSPQATPTTDFAAIEAQKENIRPLSSGRSAATLSTVFAKTEVDHVIQQGHEDHKRTIEEAERRDREGEEMVEGIMDVLDAYIKYIAFTTQHYPSSAQHLLPLLESTTRRFVQDARYAQDIRNLKLWSSYARLVERPEDIWAFLEKGDVGTKHAMFYEEWAAALEKIGRRKKADEIYRLGIARKAAPLERLKTRHKAFLERYTTSSEELPEDEPLSASSRTPGRSVLGQIATPSAAVSGATQLAPSMRVSKAANGSKMEIFADGTAVVEQAPSSEWADLGTRDGRRKENTVLPTPWKGETLPQGKVLPRTPKLEVFKDSGANGAVYSADEVFAKGRAPVSEADLIKADPLRNFDIAPSELAPIPATLPPPPSARKPPKPKNSQSHFVIQAWECPTEGPEVKDAKGKVQRRVFDWNSVFKGGEEWSFEEVRARERGLLGKEWRGEVSDWEREWHLPGSSTPKKSPPRKRMPSPTVNTKLANEEVAMMFDQTVHGGKSRDSDSDSEGDSDDDEDAPLPVAPTPLPNPTAMLRPAAGMVPPTPTPAGAMNSRPMGTALVFNDGNAVPGSSAKSTKINVFSETPAKTSLTARTPLASSSTKPRAFEIFSEGNEENEDGNQIMETPSVKSRTPLGSSNIFATPAVRQGGRGANVFAQTIPEAEEEGQEGEDQRDQVVETRPGEVDVEDVQPEFRNRLWDNSRFNIMTPITERTCEFTQMTGQRTSLAGTIAHSRHGSGTSTIGSTDEEDNVEYANVGAAEPVNNLSAVVEEDENRSNQSYRSTPNRSTDSPVGHQSGVAGPDFALPDGFTIHPGPAARTFIEPAGDDTAGIGPDATRDTESADFVTAEHGRTALTNPCNASDEDVVAELLTIIEPPLSALSGFCDCRGAVAEKLDSLQKYSKSKVRRNSAGSSRVSIAPEEGFGLTLAGKAYEIRDKIGEGGFGAVFLGIDVAARQAQDDADSDDEDEDDEAADQCMVAIKVEKPAAIWEAVVLNRVRQRLNEPLRTSIISSRNLYAFADESFLVLDYSGQGTLLDVVNKASSMGVAPITTGAPSAVDELLAIYFTIELLRTVEGLHKANFIHGDLKIDNCLVRLQPLSNAAWSTQYAADGSGGWSSQGVRLIDFGRAIDLSLYPNAGEGQTFVADWKTDQRDCLEMRQGRPWSYQADYFGLASICYCLLYGKYIVTEEMPGTEPKRYKIDQPLRRYWQADLWNPLFDALINPTALRSDGQLPITDELGAIRAKFEGWLEDNCQKGGKSLRSMLKKIELAAMTSKRM